MIMAEIRSKIDSGNWPKMIWNIIDQKLMIANVISPAKSMNEFLKEITLDCTLFYMEIVIVHTLEGSQNVFVS